MIRHLVLQSLIAVLALFATSATAQNVRLVVGGGLAQQTGSARNVGAYKLGVGYELELDQHWAFTPALEVYGKGWKSPDVWVNVLDDNGNPVLDSEGQQATSRMNRSAAALYVEIPLVMNYYFRLAPSTYVVATAGPYAALGVAGKIKTKGDGAAYADRKLFYEGNTFKAEGARRFDAGLRLGLGYQNPSGLTIALETDLGFVKTARDGECNRSALITLAYTFK